MKKIILICLGFLLLCPAFADSAQERSYLVQLINQLDAMKATVLAAQQAQLKNQRVQFHYTAWRDSSGQLHNGLLDDIQAIKQGIEAQLNNPSIEPRRFEAIKGDYLEKHS